MIITYNKTGGFGNIPVRLKTDTKDISDTSAQTALLDQAKKVLTAKPNPATMTGVPADLSNHQFSFLTDATSTKLEFDDLTLDDEASVLIEMLLTAAGK